MLIDSVGYLKITEDKASDVNLTDAKVTAKCEGRISTQTRTPHPLSNTEVTFQPQTRTSQSLPNAMVNTDLKVTFQHESASLCIFAFQHKDKPEKLRVSTSM